jgi:hypothetical protein
MLTLSLTKQGLLVNDQPIELPGTPIATLTNAVGEEPRVTRGKHNDVYSYDSDGVVAYCEPKTDIVHTVSANYQNIYDVEFAPKTGFGGTIAWDNERFGPTDDARLFAFVRKEATRQELNVKTSVDLTHGNLSVYCAFDATTKTVANIDFSQIKADEVADLPPIEPPPGKGVAFSDFNFKLAVIQVLMYDREVLTPRFDVFEFAKRYKKRAIDVDEEGYEIIREVQEFFKAYPITAEALRDIEAIDQGGGDIYLQLCPFWGGEDDKFNLKSAKDASLLPSLKRVVLFYDDDPSVLAAFKKKKIDAEFL